MHTKATIITASLGEKFSCCTKSISRNIPTQYCRKYIDGKKKNLTRLAFCLNTKKVFKKYEINIPAIYAKVYES